MLKIRKSGDRGSANIGWLTSNHTFSFGQYYDPDHMGFGPLRVINEDWIRPGAGFDTHGHQNMEIITYVLEGALEHKDSLGTGSVIRPGEVQRMSAGSGIRHSEYNASSEEQVHLLQIWVMPRVDGGAPSYDQKRFFEEADVPLMAAHLPMIKSVSLKKLTCLWVSRLWPAGMGAKVRSRSDKTLIFIPVALQPMRASLIKSNQGGFCGCRSSRAASWSRVKLLGWATGWL